MFNMDTKLLKRKEDMEREPGRIKDVIIREYSPEKIILFGSLSSGGIHEWSDIDLVIVKRTKERFIERLHKVRLMINPQEGVDFIVYTPEEVEELKRSGRRFFIKEIMEKGEVLYERSQ